VLIPIAAAILLSQSRAAIFIGVPLSILAIGLLAGGRWLWAALGVIVVGAAAAIPLLNSPRIQAIFSGGGETSFFRVALWKSTLQMIRDHPLFGVGPDNFLYAYRGRYLLPEAWQEPRLVECACSALTGEGLARVVEWLGKWVKQRTASDGDEGGIVASLRVGERLSSARDGLDRAVNALDRVPLEAVLVDLRKSQLELDQILGIEADEAVLDRIFASFCIGK